MSARSGPRSGPNPCRAPGADEVRVRALYGALSRGTERLVFSGRVPESEVRAHARAVHGRRISVSRSSTATSSSAGSRTGPRDLSGRTVFALHPHQNLFTRAGSRRSCRCRTACRHRARCSPPTWRPRSMRMWDAAPGPADRIAVVGARRAGRPGGVALRAHSRHARSRWSTSIPRAPSLPARSASRFAAPDAAPGDCDLVVHASASAAGLATALRLAGQEATVARAELVRRRAMSPVPLGEAFHSRRLRLVSSQVGSVAPSHRARWSHRRRLRGGARAAGRPGARRAARARRSLSRDLPARLPDILAPASGVLCQLIRYPDSRIVHEKEA